VTISQLPSGIYISNGHGRGPALSEAGQQAGWNLELLQERIADLEMALQDEGWRQLTHLAEQEFTRPGLRLITDLARILYLKNPLIQRGVRVKRYYVWGQGMTTKAKDEEINQVLQDFADDVKNKDELTSHQARMGKETELQTDGNIFLVFFP